MEGKSAFVSHKEDNVATVIGGAETGERLPLSGFGTGWLADAETIPKNHKIALTNIPSGSAIVKYGVTIGRASREILKGSWVHIHCMHSCYDERSSRLDPVTGARKEEDAL